LTSSAGNLRADIRMRTTPCFDKIGPTMKTFFSAIALAAALAAPAALGEQKHQHAHGETDQLGTVHFPNSCRPEVAPEFTRAVALLHSFGYEEARLAFQSVAEKDPACGIAYWGIAMTYYHPIWAPPSKDELAAGKAAAIKALDLGAATDRERGYIDAVAAFYSHEQRLDHRARAAAYRDAVEALSKRFPDDHEATIFYALSLLGTAPASDATYANQRRAAAILNGLLPVEPEHPGIAHYMIHAFDYPSLASEALPAARAYAKIAPSSPHALHMPSHIFTRLGLWQESIASNLNSAEAGRRLVAKRHPGAASFDALHALDYLEYAYLQMGDQDRARRVLEEAAAAKTFDENQFAAGYALAAIPARWTLERRDWKTAADLQPPTAQLPWDRFSYAAAVTYFAQALGAARTGQLDRSRSALGRLQEVQTALAKAPVPGPYDWAANVESTRLAAAAWLAYAGGEKDEALRMERAAAELDEKTGKHPVTPGAVLPPRELLGDMLLEMGKPAEALIEYEASLREAPNRFNGLYGAARAAELSNQPARARELYGKLAAQGAAGSARKELAEAQRYLEKRG
jgi:tetratricopeptide (TPR) repeat protein